VPWIFGLANPAPAVAALKEAGFREVRVEKVKFVATFESAEQCTQQVREMAVPLMEMMRPLGPEKSAMIWNEVTETVRRFFARPDGSIAINNDTDAIVALK
jgi:hypothetical protein